MKVYAASRISRRGTRSEGATSHLSVEMPCLNPDLAFDDTER